MTLCWRRAWKTAARFTTCPHPQLRRGRRSLFLRIYPKPELTHDSVHPPGGRCGCVQGVISREARPCCRVPFSAEAICPAKLIVAQHSGRIGARLSGGLRCYPLPGRGVLSCQGRGGSVSRRLMRSRLSTGRTARVRAQAHHHARRGRRPLRLSRSAQTEGFKQASSPGRASIQSLWIRHRVM
jgi:hypothetical protein